MGVVADTLQRLDDVGRGDLVLAPIDGETALGKIEPRVDDAGDFAEPALDLADAAGAADALYGERHMRRAGIGPFDKGRQIERLSHVGRSLQNDAVLRAEQLLALAR